MAYQRTSECDIEERAIRYTMGVVLRVTDWQDAQDALANHDEFGPWIEGIGDGIDACAVAQDIIRKAEDRLGDRVPY